MGVQALERAFTPAAAQRPRAAAGLVPVARDRRLRFGVPTLGADGGRSGIGQYVVELLAALAGLDEGRGAEVIAHEAEAAVFTPGPRGLPTFTVADWLRQPAAGVAWHQAALPVWCRRRHWDAVLLPAANRRLPLHLPCASVGTVHDFSMLHVPGKYDPLRGVYIERVLPFLVRRLTRVITVSESSKRDIVGLARVPDERVHVIPHGVDRRRFRPGERGLAASTARRYGVDRPYLLYVSRLEHPGKNHVRLIRAFERVKSLRGLPHQLVLAGPDWSGSDAVRRAARECAFADDIVFTGFVRGEDLPDLYRAAELLVFPSLYEGFGMPLLEAMACGTPVACSATSSLPEVAGDAALLFDPTDEAALASAIQRVLERPDLGAGLSVRGLERAARFTWERAAALTLDVLRQAASEHRR